MGSRGSALQERTPADPVSASAEGMRTGGESLVHRSSPVICNSVVVTEARTANGQFRLVFEWFNVARPALACRWGMTSQEVTGEICVSLYSHILRTSSLHQHVLEALLHHRSDFTNTEPPQKQRPSEGSSAAPAALPGKPCWMSLQPT